MPALSASSSPAPAAAAPARRAAPVALAAPPPPPPPPPPTPVQSLTTPALATGSGAMGVGRFGRGLFATAPARAGERLVTVPLDNCLIVAADAGGGGGGGAPAPAGPAADAAARWQAAHGALPPALAAYVADAAEPAAHRLAAWLLWAARAGGGGPAWRGYGALLGAEGDYSCLLNYRDGEDAAALQCEALVAEAAAQRRGAEAAAARLAALGLAPRGLADAAWALAAVRSRTFAFRLGGLDVQAPAMLLPPVLDLANHAQSPNAAVSAVSPPAGGGVLQIVAQQRLGRGEEVTIDYGRKSNFEMMRDYGFVVPGNPYDAPPPVPAPPAGDGAPAAALHAPTALAAFGAGAGALRPRPRAAGDGGAAADAAARRLCALRALPLWGRPDEPRPPGGAPAARPDAARELAAADRLADAWRARLGGYATTVEHDERLLQGAALGARGRAAVAARLERKLLLRAGLEVLAAHAAAVGEARAVRLPRGTGG